MLNHLGKKIPQHTKCGINLFISQFVKVCIFLYLSISNLSQQCIVAILCMSEGKQEGNKTVASM